MYYLLCVIESFYDFKDIDIIFFNWCIFGLIGVKFF